MKILFALCCCCLIGCGHPSPQPSATEVHKVSLTPDSLLLPPVPQALSQTARYLDSLGLINIAEADSSFVIDLMYTRRDNFTGTVLYEDLHEAYLHPDALNSLLKAQQLLQKRHHGYSLIIYDAARPLSVQQKMWDKVKGTPQYQYVSNPAHGGGLHNYGLAVDVSIVDDAGKPLPMGTQVDHLGVEAHITNEKQLVASGRITQEEQNNRLLLRNIMQQAGFRVLPTEWWHFNWTDRNTARKNYPIIK